MENLQAMSVAILPFILCVALGFLLYSRKWFTKLYDSTAAKIPFTTIFGGTGYRFTLVTEEQKMWVKQQGRFSSLARDLFAFAFVLVIVQYIPEIETFIASLL